MSIGSRIKELRNNLGLTQEELAMKLNLTKGAIANYENSVSVPKTEIMYKLFEVLHCDANYLYQDDIKTKNYTNNIFSVFEIEHIKKYRQLDAYGKDMVNTVLDKEMARLYAGGKISDIPTIKTYDVAFGRGVKRGSITMEQAAIAARIIAEDIEEKNKE